MATVWVKTLILVSMAAMLGAATIDERAKKRELICPEPGVGICIVGNCQSDTDCRKTELCCPNGCGGLFCTTGCPIEAEVGDGDGDCESNADCTGKKICCSNGVAKRCVKP
ncbi:waprin-Phi2-like [Glandiceps talaboti]